MYIKRTIEKSLINVNKSFPVLLITGPRQVGKTTLLEHFSEPGRAYISLDDPEILFLAKNDPALFFQNFEPPLIIDEIQYAPELFSYIKMIVDKKKQNGLFWLTGSQQFELMKGVTETLAGRVGILNILGFSLNEISHSVHVPFLPGIIKKPSNKNKNIKELYDIIWRGSFPAIVTNSELDRDLFYKSYLKTYLMRDVHQLSRVGDEMSFLRFLKITATRTAQELNITSIARDSDISPNTAKSWLSILEASGLIYFLKPYFTNISKRIIKTPKLYFLDTGLCAYLSEWNSPQTLELGAMSGAIFETHVINEILKSYYHNGIEPPLYYYRDKAKNEIDLLISQGDTIYPVEIKKTANPVISMAKNFSLVKELGKKQGYGLILCLSNNNLQLSETLGTISVWNI